MLFEHPPIALPHWLRFFSPKNAATEINQLWERLLDLIPHFVEQHHNILANLCRQLRNDTKWKMGQNHGLKLLPEGTALIYVCPFFISIADCLCQLPFCYPCLHLVVRLGRHGGYVRID